MIASTSIRSATAYKWIKLSASSGAMVPPEPSPPSPPDPPIHDRDPLFTKNFATILRDARVKVVKLPPSGPNLNAFAERFVGSIRRECLDHIIPLGK